MEMKEICINKPLPCADLLTAAPSGENIVQQSFLSQFKYSAAKLSGIIMYEEAVIMTGADTSV